MPISLVTDATIRSKCGNQLVLFLFLCVHSECFAVDASALLHMFLASVQPASVPSCSIDIIIIQYPQPPFHSHQFLIVQTTTCTGKSSSRTAVHVQRTAPQRTPCRSLASASTLDARLESRCLRRGGVYWGDEGLVQWAFAPRIACSFGDRSANGHHRIFLVPSSGEDGHLDWMGVVAGEGRGGMCAMPGRVLGAQSSSSVCIVIRTRFELDVCPRVISCVALLDTLRSAATEAKQS